MFWPNVAWMQGKRSRSASVWIWNEWRSGAEKPGTIKIPSKFMRNASSSLLHICTTNAAARTYMNMIVYESRIFVVTHSHGHTHTLLLRREISTLTICSLYFIREKTIGKSRAKGFARSASTIYIFMVESTRLPRILNDRLSNSVRHMNTRESV